MEGFEIYSFPELQLLIKYLVTKLYEQTNWSIHVVVCKFYWEMDSNEK